MKKLLFLILIIFYSKNTCAQTVNLNNPDLELFLLNNETIDTNGDDIPDTFIDSNRNNVIEQSEISSISNLYLIEVFSSSTIYSLNGLEFFTQLNHLEIRRMKLNNPDFSLFQNLEYLLLDRVSDPTIININSNTLEKLELINMNQLDVLIFQNTPLLEDLNLHSNSSLFTRLDVSTLTQLKSLQLNATFLSNLDINSNINLKSLIINKLGSVLDLSNNNQIETLHITADQFYSNILNHVPFLKDFILYGNNINTPIASIDFSANSLLQKISIFSTSTITSLNLSNNFSLNDLELSNLINLVNLDISAQNQLNRLKLRTLGIFSLDLTNNTAITNLGLSDLSLNSSVDLSSLNYLENLFVENVSISDYSLLTKPFLKTLFLRELHVPTLSFDLNFQLEKVTLYQVTLLSTNLSINKPNLDFISIFHTNLTEISLMSNVPDWSFLISNNDNLTSVFVKNNSMDQIHEQSCSLLWNDNLSYVCTDEADIDLQNNFLSLFGFNNVNVNSYCSFTPGGNFSEIQGAISIDTDNNGCDPTDPVFSNFNFTATDGTLSGSISSDQSGNYYVPVSDGQHIITPNPENPTYWNFTPANVVVDFPTQASPFTQDFCVTANGSIEDLEVIVVPLEQARPGFDTDYKVVVKNKGNVTTSGTVNLDFEEDFMSLLSSAPTAVMPASNQLSWSVSNLQPFQMEEYEFTMTLNTPTQTTNPLNGGDLLTFTGTVIGTATDAMPADNVMVFDQTVVNSYDPNDKTCLEGETITPAMVGEYVHYMIRFENTGTASALNVVVKDEIDLSQFDISTLIPLGGSHDYYTRVRDGNVVEFIHENINLDFNNATNDGYVLFKIKTLSTLLEGDTFDNLAEIYFDFNAPIITNTETVTVMNTASIAETTDASITVYPNPARDYIQISSSNGLKSASIIDVNGRMLSHTNFIGSLIEQRISTQNLNSGVYFISIQSEVGQKVEKVVVE